MKQLSAYTNEERGLSSFVIQITPSIFVAKLVNEATIRIYFDNFNDANLTARDFVGKDLCGYQVKTKPMGFLVDEEQKDIYEKIHNKLN